MYTRNNRGIVRFKGDAMIQCQTGMVVPRTTTCTSNNSDMSRNTCSVAIMTTTQHLNVCVNYAHMVAYSAKKTRLESLNKHTIMKLPHEACTHILQHYFIWHIPHIVFNSLTQISHTHSFTSINNHIIIYNTITVPIPAWTTYRQ